jgi:DNA helicase HerA-like ATPase
MDDEVINVVSSILSRVFFDYVKQQKERNSKPIHLVLDEAHRYISNTKGYEESFEANKIFERISKEARKYGLFLIISSQRPSEVNETVISQCNNFIIHRIQNPNDLSYIKSMTPFISESVIRQLPSIPRQEALVFGTATNLPVLFKVKDANPLPDSKNNEITKNWK